MLNLNDSFGVPNPKKARNATPAFSAIRAWHIAPDTETPYPLQLANIEYISRRRHALVGDEPGSDRLVVLEGGSIGQYGRAGTLRAVRQLVRSR